MASRTKNTVRNINAGLVNRIIHLLFGFIVRTVMIKILGTEYLGLGSLFSSILQMLSLAELGFGNAVVFSMYKPIAENDKQTVCALLNLYKKFYHIVGIIVFVIGLAVMPFLKHLIRGDYPYGININFLYVLYLFNTVISYFLFSYKVSIFIANQRDDIRCNINSLLYTLMYLGQILALVFTENYYLYTVLFPVCTICINVLQEIIARHMYPEYVCIGRLERDSADELKKQVIGLASYQIGGVIYNNMDSMVISVFLGLTSLARYTNYYYIMYGLTAVLNIFANAVTASVGNYVATESIEKNKKQFHIMSNVFTWIVGWCSICLMCLFQPFMYLWMGEENLLPLDNVFWFSVYFYFWNFNPAVPVYKKAAGIWWQDRIRPLIGVCVNFCLNIWWVRFMGINGVVLSSIVSTAIISIPWSSYYLFKCYLKINLKEYLLSQLKLLIATLIIGGVTCLLCGFCKFNSLIISIFVKGIICLIIPNIIYIIFFKTSGNWNVLEEYLRKYKNLLVRKII